MTPRSVRRRPARGARRRFADMFSAGRGPMHGMSVATDLEFPGTCLSRAAPALPRRRLCAVGTIRQWTKARFRSDGLRQRFCPRLRHGKRSQPMPECPDGSYRQDTGTRLAREAVTPSESVTGTIVHSELAQIIRSGFRHARFVAESQMTGMRARTAPIRNGNECGKRRCPEDPSGEFRPKWEKSSRSERKSVGNPRSLQFRNNTSLFGCSLSSAIFSQIPLCQVVRRISLSLQRAAY